MNSIPAIEQVAGRGAARAAARNHGRRLVRLHDAAPQQVTHVRRE